MIQICEIHGMNWPFGLLELWKKLYCEGQGPPSHPCYHSTPGCDHGSASWVNVQILLEPTAQGCREKEENSNWIINSEPCLWSDTNTGTTSVCWYSCSAAGSLCLCRTQLPLHIKIWNWAQEMPPKSEKDYFKSVQLPKLVCCGWCKKEN